NGVNYLLVDTSGNVTVMALVQTSDRNAKENFAAVSPLRVLDKVLSLPISQWNFKADAGTTHIGPMAQDFYAAFGVGPDDKHIATVDGDGVALAAIQGLNEKVETRSQKVEGRTGLLEERLQQKETEITDLKARLEKLERLLDDKQNGGGK